MRNYVLQYYNLKGVEATEGIEKNKYSNTKKIDLLMSMKRAAMW